MSQLRLYDLPDELVLGTRHNDRVPKADQDRQRAEVEEILERLRDQPGVILADEVGMGKTFVALAVVYSIARSSKRGPVIVMVPPNLIDKWEQDLRTFCELYLDGQKPVRSDAKSERELRQRNALRYGTARHSVELMKLLDDEARLRCHIIFVAQGAMSRRQSDKWVRLALVREALRRHGRGRATRLLKVKKNIHRFLAELLHAIGEQSAHAWGEDLWSQLLRTDPSTWKGIFNEGVSKEGYQLADDPVPQAIVAALDEGLLNLRPLATALEEMPLRSMSKESDQRRIADARQALKEVEQEVWKALLAKAKWRSPLLVMDEAHHLKNPATSLARQLQSADTDQDLRVGDGAMARAFDRMLFLTATPFQLGHQELVRVLERFGDIKWDKAMRVSPETFDEQLMSLNHSLTESQRTAVMLQKHWMQLTPEDLLQDDDVDAWWRTLQDSPLDQLSHRQKALRDAFENTRRWRADAEQRLKPWVIRHNKGQYWPQTEISRRERRPGASILAGSSGDGGLPVPPTQLLPFFLAARSAISAGKDLLGEALCSSYEAFRHTREHRQDERDEQEEPEEVDLSHSAWYLSEFDSTLQQYSGRIHPKVTATVQTAVDLWERGEKVLVFAFYRRTCRALRIHISEEIERRMLKLGRQRLTEAGRDFSQAELIAELAKVQDRYFDTPEAPGRRALETELNSLLDRRQEAFLKEDRGSEQREQLLTIMRSFLRVKSTLVRCFPFEQDRIRAPSEIVRLMLDETDGSGQSWREKFGQFVEYFIDRCTESQRQDYLHALTTSGTGAVHVSSGEPVEYESEERSSGEKARVLVNVQEATGRTKRNRRARLMRSFNTPFFPDILVCSEVMSEGVDLQRYCRYVIHHDLAWNPSQIEQRTGRIDRLGCKAENQHPIHVYLPYLAGASDERQYRVMSDREQWFRIVMGQDEVAKLIPQDDSSERPPLPSAFAEDLSFDLGLR